MIYSQFVSKTHKYLNSVRVLKNYITFDMLFPTTWVMLKKLPEGVEILQNTDKEGKVITSFVCENNLSLIDSIEVSIDKVVKTNVEREEKEKLCTEFVRDIYKTVDDVLELPSFIDDLILNQYYNYLLILHHILHLIIFSCIYQHHQYL